jgi:hypothetical protein
LLAMALLEFHLNRQQHTTFWVQLDTSMSQVDETRALIGLP